jgi:SM-20-related protein
MTPKQILDSFSETLMQDERILSSQERALVATLLQHAKSATNEDQKTQDAVRAVIASAVGETVAQRAFVVLGGSIVDRILDSSSLPQTDWSGRTTEYAGPKTPKEPDPPGIRAPKKPMRDTPVSPPPTGPKEPDPPGVRAPQKPMRDTPVSPPPTGPKEPDPPGVRAPGKPMRDTPVPVPGKPKEPDPPSGARTTVISATHVDAAQRPAVLPAKCVVLDEFLAPAELADLTRFVLDHEADFKTSEVVSPEAGSGIVNYEHRRSRVLMDLAEYQDMMLERIKSTLPHVLDRLGMENFDIADVEVQATASNDGDFFHFHSDNGSERVASRYLTFVYFFHREPRRFEGGELRIHDSHLEEGAYVSDGSYQTIVPQQNQIVFFPCEMLHEITPVNCASQQFADSRFTVNGWLRR